VNFCDFLVYSKKKLFSSYSEPVRTGKILLIAKMSSPETMAKGNAMLTSVLKTENSHGE